MDKPAVDRPVVDGSEVKHWEDVLKKQDLGEEQLGLVEDQTPDPEPIRGRRVSNRKNRTIEILEAIVDKDDLFITGSQISKIRTEERQAPDWALNNKRIREVLLEVFPKLQTESKQRLRAARWAAVIYMFYRLGMTYTQIAEELNITKKASDRLIQNISLVFEGKRPDTASPRGLRKRGRPKNTRK